MKRSTSIVAFVGVVIALLLLAPNAGHGQDRTDERLSSLETRVSILEAGQPTSLTPVASPVASDADATWFAGFPTSPPPTVDPEALTITGSITVYGDDNSLSVIGKACFGLGGYGDMNDGSSVTVRNGSGDIIAASRLENGTWTNRAPTRTICTWTFEVRVPRTDFYVVEVGHRGGLTYTYSDLDLAGWQVDLVLGN